MPTKNITPVFRKLTPEVWTWRTGFVSHTRRSVRWFLSLRGSRDLLLVGEAAVVRRGLDELDHAFAIRQCAVVVLELHFTDIAVQVLAGDGMVRPADLTLQASPHASIRFVVTCTPSAVYRT